MPSTPKFYLYKRKNGIYYVGYFHGDRLRWKSTRTTVKSEALRAISNLQALLHPKPVSTSLSQFVKDFLVHAPANFARRTVIIYGQTLANFERVVGEETLSNFTLRHFDMYKTRRLAQVLPVSVNIELRALKAAMNTALRWKLLEVNPFAGGQLARVAEKCPAFFSHSDFGKLISCVEESWLKELIVFAVATGMRQGEIVNLRWQDIDLERRLIQIESHSSFHTKQGRRRTIPMSEFVHDMLQVRANPPSGEFVFGRYDRKLGESYLTHRFKTYVRIAGLSDELHWHSLRHTHASWLVQDGATLYEVQKLLGHTSSRITEKYSHLQPGNLHGTVNRIKF
jgi:site-specific recombinase XerD